MREKGLYGGCRSGFETLRVNATIIIFVFVLYCMAVAWWLHKGVCSI